MKINILFIVLGLLTACIGENKKYNRSPISKKEEIVEIKPGEENHVYLEGKFLSSNGDVFDLQEIQNKNTVLIFAQETCAVCIEETKVIKKYLTNHEVTKINLYTLLVGADEEISQEWMANYGVTWTVGYDENLELFNRYCPDKLTPCVLIQDVQKGIVLQKSGSQNISDLIKLSGPWY